MKQALEEILTSDEMRRSPSQSAFLRYVVEETLLGNAARIKAYSIATEALGRTSSFDPGGDPIVRVEAMRLRRSLDRYYLHQGRSEPLVISLPKGKYVPLFSPLNVGGADQSVPRRPFEQDSMPSIALLLDYSGANFLDSNPIATIIGDKIADAIGRFGFRFAGKFTLETSDAPIVSKCDFVIRVSFDTADPNSHVALHFRVWDGDSKTIIWTDTHDMHDPASTSSIVANLCSSVLGHSGIAHRHNILKMLSGKQFASRYECQLRYLRAVQNYADRATDSEARIFVENSLQRDPGFAAAYSFLAHLTYRQSFQFAPGEEFETFMLKAWHLALKGVELSPASSFSYSTLYWLSDLRGETNLAEAALDAAKKLNPYDNDLVRAQGARLIGNGDVHLGIELIEKNLTDGLAQPVQYLFYLALGKYLIGDLAGAEKYGLRIPADLSTMHQSHPGALLLRTLLARAQGNEALAKVSARAVEKNMSLTQGNMEHFLQRFFTDRSLASKLEADFRRSLN